MITNEQWNVLIEVLSDIRDCLKKGLEYLEPGIEKNPVLTNPSLGACPSCGSSEVTMKGSYPKAIYRCESCSVIWINDPEAIFK